MTRSLRNLSVAACAVLAACNVSIPEGKFACATAKDCPSDWVCFEAVCYSETPSRPGDGGGGQNGGNEGNGNGNGNGNGGNAGSNAGDAGAPDDAGIDTTSCDAPTTFYRDSDNDGLGASAQSIQACSVDNGYATNADDCNDLCMACSKPDAAEVCDGFDNECDGKVDDGKLEFSTRVSFAALPKSVWAEVVDTAQGAVIFSPVTGATGAAIVGQRFDREGKTTGDPVPIDGAQPASGAYNIAAAHLDGKIVLAWFEASSIQALVLDAATLTTLVTEKTVASGSIDTPALDVALSTSASGGRALFSYAQSKTVKTQAFRIADLVVEGSVQTIYTPTDVPNFLGMVTLTAAPCLSGFYAAVLDEFLRVLRIIPLGDDGVPSGTSYNVPTPGDLFFTALPALRVEGGDCDSVPTRLVLAYAIEETLLPAATSDIHVDYLNITRTNNLDKFTLANSAQFEQSGGVLPAYFFFPSGAVFIYRALDLIAYDGRYLVALATAASVDADRAGLDVVEIDGTNVVATHKAVQVQPAGPRALQLVVAQGRAWLGTSNWTNQDPAGLLRIGCGGSP